MRPARLPRRKPRQERSRITVNAIVEAAARVFSVHGFERASTNRIAAAAGVSVGSLYQYFPDKTALLLAVESATHERLMRRLQSACTPPAAHLEQTLHAIATAGADHHREHARLNRVLARHLPAVDSMPMRRTPGTTPFHAALRTVLRQHHDELTVEPELALFLLRNLARSLLTAAVEHRPGQLQDGTIAHVLSRAALAILTGPAAMRLPRRGRAPGTSRAAPVRKARGQPHGA